MYKNVKVLDKEKFKGIKFNEINLVHVAKNVGLIPMGFTEAWHVSHYCPIVISAGAEAEFLAFTGITQEITIYNKDEVYLPLFIRSYPFVNLLIKNEKNEINSVIAIDENSECVGKNKKHLILNKNKELTKEASEKIELVRELNRQRDVSKKIIAELKAHDLLLKKDLKVNVNGEERTIIEEFYVINIEKLIKLDDATLANWTRKGWIGIFDAHIKSLGNFQKVLSSNK